MDETKKILLLFDTDGTLTPHRQKIKEEMLQVLKNIDKNKFKLAIVSGSDIKKQEEQLGKENFYLFEYIFAENGLAYYNKNNKIIFEGNLLNYFNEENLQEFLNECLIYIANLKIPQKRGTFIEYRKGLINISPIGRNCSNIERDNFELYDKKHHIREKMILHLKNKFKHLNLTYSIGGQISFDVFPNGWDKTYCLNHLQNEKYKKIYFFGDKTYKGGNDYELFIDNRVIGHTVNNWKDTFEHLKNIILKY